MVSVPLTHSVEDVVMLSVPLTHSVEDVVMLSVPLTHSVEDVVMVSVPLTHSVEDVFRADKGNGHLGFRIPGLVESRCSSRRPSVYTELRG